MTTYALLDPNVFYKNDENKLAVNYVEKDRGAFDVAPPFYWLECPDELDQNFSYYDLIEQKFVIVPQSIPESTI